MRADQEEPGDVELAEFVDYFAGELPPERAAKVRRRLEDDPELAQRMRPMIAAWMLEVGGRSRGRALVRGESETLAAWRELRRRIEPLRDLSASGAQTGSWRGAPTRIESGAQTIDYPGSDNAGRARTSPSWQRRVYRGLVMPAVWSFVLLVVLFYGHGVYLILGPGWVKGHIARTVHGTLRRPIIDVVTNHGNEQLVRLPDGSSAVLDLMTWLSYPEHFGTVARNIQLVGRARFTVAPDGTFPFRVRAGPALLEGGERYTVDYVDPSHAVTVWVTSGSVTIGRTGVVNDRPTVVTMGHVARVTGDFVQVDTALTPPPVF